MLAISQIAALRNMVDMGLVLSVAHDRLASLKPAARMDGMPYYNPSQVHRVTVRALSLEA